MKQTVRSCIMGLVGGCIDPCDDCPNMNAVKFDTNGDVIESTLCQLEQGSKECYALVCKTCKQFKPRGTLQEQIDFVERYKKIYS